MTKSIKQQYIDLREGRMSQSNFLRNVRMSLPNYVTNLNDFNSTIKILKNKGILNENDIYGVAGNPEEEAEMKSMDLKNYNVDTEQLKQGTEVEMEHTNDPKVAERIAMDHLKEDPEYYIKLKSIGLEEANPGIDPTQEDDYKPLTSSKSDYEVINSDGEVALLKDKNGDQFVFWYADNKKEIEPYSSDGYDIDDMAIQHYINDNSYGLSKGVGMVDYEAGKDLVKVDDDLKDNFSDLFSVNEEKEPLYTEDIFNHPEASHIIDSSDQNILEEHFREEQDGEEIPNLVGLTSLEAAKEIGPVDFEEETLQHIIAALNPDKFDPIYENQEELSPKMKHIQKSMGKMDSKPTTAERRAELEKLIAAKKAKQKMNESDSEITNFKSKHGSEGPTHDPYGYVEYSFNKDGKNYIVHMGLAQYIKIDGQKIEARGAEYDNPDKFILNHIGVDFETLHNLETPNNYDEDPMGPPSRYMENKKPIKESKEQKGGTSGKELYSNFKEMDLVNSQELLIGIDWEMQKSFSLSKKDAAKKAIKNIKKVPNYYTMFCLSGVEGAEPQYYSKDVKPEDWQMKPFSADKVVDKGLGMKPVKGFNKEKASANKAHKETNKGVAGVKELTHKAVRARGIKGVMDMTGGSMKKIREGYKDPFNEPDFEKYLTQLEDYYQSYLEDGYTHISAKKTSESSIDEDLIRDGINPKQFWDWIDKDIDNNGIYPTEDDSDIFEVVNKALAQSRLEEITGAYGGDAMSAEDGSSYINDRTDMEAKAKDLLSNEAYRTETGWNENELNEFLNSFTNEDIEHDYQAFVVGGLNENQENALQYAQNYANNWSSYIDKNSIKFEEFDESWYLEFNLNIPIRNMRGNIEWDTEELENDLEHSSHGVEGNPGGQYSKSFIDVQEKGGYYIVNVNVRGGYDI